MASPSSVLKFPNTGNGERGTGVWERVYSGKLPDNLIQNGGRGKQRGNK